MGMATSLTTLRSDSIANAVQLVGSNTSSFVPVTHCYPEAVDIPACLYWDGVYGKFPFNI